MGTNSSARIAPLGREQRMLFWGGQMPGFAAKWEEIVTDLS
jgi:hypothetical protein